MPFQIVTGQVDSESFRKFFNKKLSGSASYPSGFYTHDNVSGFLSLTEGGSSSFTGHSGDMMGRVSGLTSNVSGALDTSGQFLLNKAEGVSGHAETFTTAASGFLSGQINTVSGQFSSTSGEFLKSGSLMHTGSGDFSITASTGALAYSSGYNNSPQGLFVATGDTTYKASWMKLAGYPEMTGFVSASSGDIKTSLAATGSNLKASIENLQSDSSTVFSAQKTFNSGIKTEKVSLGVGGVTLRTNSNKSVTFDDASGALLTLSPGYGADAPVFSVTDKAGLPLMDIFDDDRINLGPYGKNPLNLSGDKVCLGNYKSYFSGSNIHLSGDLTINDIMTVSGRDGGYMILNGLPNYPNTGGLADGTLFVSGGTAGKGRYLMVI